MSFPRYPEYKDSGVEWLGEVPEHWESTQLKRVVNPDRQITYGIVQAGPHIPSGVPYIRPADMTDEHGIFDRENVMRTSLEIASGYSRSTIRAGDLVCSIGPSFGKAMLTPDWLDGANLTQGTARIAIHPPHDNHFFFWFLRSVVSVAQWESSVGGATFRALNLGPLAETRISVPPPAEQTRIAAFLDRETAKIDGLVAEQRRLMELLKEKRQAVISHAVTKGLNPDAPMKPSGIEWLGDVPEHWEVTRLSYYASVENGTTPSRNNPDYWQGGNVPWLSSGEVNQYRITKAKELITKEALDECSLRLLPKGTIVIGMIGQGKTRGLSAYLEIEACINQNLAAVVLREEVKPDYLHYIFQSVYEYLREFGRGGNQAALNCQILSALKVPLPPLEEQPQICDLVKARLQEFDDLTAEAQRAIDLLQERRTALISAAVTGQIDVRQIAGEVAA